MASSCKPQRNDVRMRGKEPPHGFFLAYDRMIYHVGDSDRLVPMRLRTRLKSMFIRNATIYMCIAALPDAVPVHEYRYESSSLSGYLSLDFHLYSTVAQLRAAPLFNFPCATTTPDNDTLPQFYKRKHTYKFVVLIYMANY